jgi:hypothetical protein
MGYGGWAWLLPLLLATEPVIMFFSKGMESAAFMMFILASLWALGSERPLVSAALFAGAVLTRLDGLILAPIIAGVGLLRLLRNEDSAKQWLRMATAQAAIFAAITAPWFAFAWYYFGNPIPATITQKMGQIQQLKLERFGSLFVRHFFWDDRLGLPYVRVVPFLVGMAALALKRRPRFWLVEWWWLYLLVYVLANMPMYLWYMFPLYPPAIAMTTSGMAEMGRWAMGYPAGRRRTAAIATAILAVCVVAEAVEPLRLLAPIAVSPGDSPFRDLKCYGEIGRYLADSTAPDSVVAAHEVGLIGYYSQRRILDLTGLTCPLPQSQRQRNSLDLATERLPDYFVIPLTLYLEYGSAARERFRTVYQHHKTFVGDPYTAEAVLLFARRDIVQSSNHLPDSPPSAPHVEKP